MIGIDNTRVQSRLQHQPAATIQQHHQNAYCQTNSVSTITCMDMVTRRSCIIANR